jgi:hypothetical protein
LICSDSHWALNALKESGHSSHSVLAPLQAFLKGLKGRVCFQWVPAHCGLLGNKRADDEAMRAVNLGPDDGVQRERISFEVVKGLIRSEVKDGPPSHARTSRMDSDGPFRRLQEETRSCLPNLGVVAPYYLGKPGKGSNGRTLCGEEEEVLEHILRTCPELEIPKRNNFVQVPYRSRSLRRTRRMWHGSSGRSSIGTTRVRRRPKKNDFKYN